MTTILVNIAKVHDRIQQAAHKSSRVVTDITLMAVSKTQPASFIAEAHRQGGLLHFGENYAQEAETKLAALKDLPLTWQEGRFARIERIANLFPGVEVTLQPGPKARLWGRSDPRDAQTEVFGRTSEIMERREQVGAEQNDVHGDAPS